MLVKFYHLPKWNKSCNDIWLHFGHLLNIDIMTALWLRDQCVLQAAPGCQNHQQGEVMAKSMLIQKTYVISYTRCYYSYWRSCHTETLQPPATSPRNLISLENRVGSYSVMKKSFGNMAARHPREKWWYPRVQRRFTGDRGWLCHFSLRLLLLSCEPEAAEYSVAPCTVSIWMLALVLQVKAVVWASLKIYTGSTGISWNCGVFSCCYSSGPFTLLHKRCWRVLSNHSAHTLWLQTCFCY